MIINPRITAIMVFTIGTQLARGQGRCSAAAYVRLPSAAHAVPIFVTVPAGAANVHSIAEGRELNLPTAPWVRCDKTPGGQVIGYRPGAQCDFGAAGFVNETSYANHDGTSNWLIYATNDSGTLPREMRYVVSYDCGPKYPPGPTAPRKLGPGRCASASYMVVHPQGTTATLLVTIPQNAPNVVGVAEGREDALPWPENGWLRCDQTPGGQVIGYKPGAQCTNGAAGFPE